MKRVYAGMDLGSKECSATRLDNGGDIIDNVSFQTSERNLIDWAKACPKAVVLIEEGELAGWAGGILKLHLPPRNGQCARQHIR